MAVFGRGVFEAVTAQRFEYDQEQLQINLGVFDEFFSNLPDQQTEQQYRTLVTTIQALCEPGRGESAWAEQVGNLFKHLLEESGIYVWEWILETDEVLRYPDTEQLFGLSKQELEPRIHNITRHIHPDHQKQVEETLQYAIQNHESYQIQYILDTPETQRQWIEEHGFVLVDEQNQARRLVGFSNDITAKKEYQRNLNWERELNETIRTAFINSQDRSDLESTVVRHLYDYGYSLVWIGDWLADELQPRSVVGKEVQVEALGFDTSIKRHEQLPSIKAAVEREPNFVSDFTGNSKSEWHKTAYRCGFRSAGTLPLIYNDICYGVLSLYSEEPDTFDETTNRNLVSLSDTLAAVLHNIETESILSSDRHLRAKIQLFGANYYLRELVAQAECSDIRINVHETLPHGEDDIVQFVSVDGTDVDVLLDAASSNATVCDSTVMKASERMQLVHQNNTPETTLAGLGARVHSTSVTAERTDILIEVPNKNVLRTAIEALEGLSDHVSVLSCTESGTNQPQRDEHPLGELTERQLTVLQAAHHHGYFKQPREASATEVAESLNITHPTFLEHLRIAQGKLFDHYF